MRIPQIFTLIRDLHPLANTHAEHTNKGDKQFSLLVAFCRNEATRTPDPYVPNVVRYQLRYIPIVFEKWCHQESNFFKNLFVICWHSAFFYILKLLKPLNQP